MARFRRLVHHLHAAWLLPGGLAAAAAVVVAFNTLALPAAAPGLVWGPVRPVSNALGDGHGPDRRMHLLMRGEIEDYLNQLPPDDTRAVIVRDWQRARRLQASGLGETVVAAMGPGPRNDSLGRFDATPRAAAPPDGAIAVQGNLPLRGVAPPGPAQQGGFLVPLGLHRPGAEGIGLYALSFISFATLAALLVFLAPARFRSSRDALLNGQPLKALAVGVLAYSLAALLSLFLAMLVVGGPLASLVLGAMLLLSLAGLVTVTLAVGRFLVRRVALGAASPTLELVTGVLALYTLAVLPYLGWPLVVIAASIGLGSMILTRFGSGEAWSLQSLE